ncbi:MAG: hypothetical protein LLF87_01990 [Eubacteriales bacterium]|nr:hypothetical protein [Eubacteriales bacterium]
MEKLIILTGSLMGTMRVRTEKQGTFVEIALRKGSPGAYTAYLVDGRGALCEIKLDASLKGDAPRPFDAHAALVAADTAHGTEFAAEGGFIGRSTLLEQAKRDVRILRAANAPRKAEERPVSLVQKAVAPAAREDPVPLAQKAAVQESAEQPRLYSAGNAGADAAQEPWPNAQKTRIYGAGSAADAIGEQARLTREYAGAARVREEREEEDAFRPPEGAQSPRALDEILKKADELFRPLDAQFALGADAPAAENAVYNPFPDAFPASRWKKVNYPGTSRFYLEGETEQNGVKLLLHALPGEYAPVPPMRRRGFTRFLRAADGSGYWVRVQRR